MIIGISVIFAGAVVLYFMKMQDLKEEGAALAAAAAGAKGTPIPEATN